MEAQVTITVRADPTGRPYEVAFVDADALGARFVVGRLALPGDPREALYGYVSWTGRDLLVVVQDPDRGEHALRTIPAPWLFRGCDFTPLDDAGNAEHAAAAVAAAAAEAMAF